MSKGKPWLENVVRIANNKNSRHISCVRLDKSERIFRFNENFFNEFLGSLSQEDFIAYPETSLLVDKICDLHGVKEENVFLTPGTDPAIKAFFEIAVNPHDDVLITKPCFPMYNVYGALFNAKLIEISYRPDLSFDFERMIDSINENTALVLLANPNSPLGNFLEIDLVELLIAKANKYGIPIMIDEAYYEFSPGTAMDLVNKYDNLGVSRTFSKALGGAGIRIGYVIGHSKLIARLSKWRLMYEVNQVGVKFASFLIDNIDSVKRYAEQTIREREIMVKLLKGKGFDVISSHTNSIHFHGKLRNKEVIETLKNFNVLFKSDTVVPYDVRKDWIRLSIGPGLTQTPYFKKVVEGAFVGK